ncbi:MAG: rod-binding protein [Aureliella sp.]
MHITPYQATISPSTGTTTTGAQPFTLNVTRPAVPLALDSLSVQSTSDPFASSAEEDLQATNGTGTDDLKDAFQDFVGQTFFGEMIKSFRTTQQPSKYFHGGRAEEIFQGQFDQVLTEKLSDASSDKISNPMYELFMLKRSS